MTRRRATVRRRSETGTGTGTGTGTETGTETGTVTVLVVGFVVVVGLLVAVVVDASAAYLRRQQVTALADGAALAAADGAQGEEVYTSGLGVRADIDPVQARAHVAAYLQRTEAAAAFPGLSWQVSTNGTEVQVRLAAPLELPITPSGWVGETSVDGVASAVVEVR